MPITTFLILKAHDGFYGIVAPFIAANETTWLFNEEAGGVLIRAECWNCTYELINAACLPLGYGEDPMLYLDKRENLHIVYHKFAENDYSGMPCRTTGGCGGHAYSADGGLTWHVGPTVYNSTIAYANGTTINYLTRQRQVHYYYSSVNTYCIICSHGIR